MGAYWPHAEHSDWWDGPARFKRINRCEVATIQNEVALRLLNALCPGPKLEVGGPTLPDSPGIYADYEVLDVVAKPGVTVVGDGCAMPFGPASFAAVASFHTVEHVHDAPRYIAECERVLRPGGVLLIVCPDRRHMRHDLSKDALGERCYAEYVPEELLALLRRAAPRLEVVSHDARQNCYDFEVLARRLP